ncbi:hypothetical protein SAMN05216264_108243 [Pseudomonas marincola]|nr:hypothetical protein SAMN05216264_108243 [Pseudomonas marincola]
MNALVIAQHFYTFIRPLLFALKLNFPVQSCSGCRSNRDMFTSLPY